MLLAAFTHWFFGTLMFISAVFLILLVLIQRGRGGGLSGAFGGMGGQSAFGARAGDTFTWITIWASAAWIILCICSVKFLGDPPDRFQTQTTSTSFSPSIGASTTGGPAAGDATAEDLGEVDIEAGLPSPDVSSGSANPLGAAAEASPVTTETPTTESATTESAPPSDDALPTDP